MDNQPHINEYMLNVLNQHCKQPGEVRLYPLPERERIGEGYHRNIQIRQGLELDYSEMKFHQPISLQATFDYPHLELAINLDGSTQWSIDKSSVHFDSSTGSAQLIYMNNIYFQAQMLQDQAMTHLELRFDPALWQGLLEELKIRPEQSFACIDLKISPEMYDVARQLVHNSYHGQTGKLYREAKSLELLSLALDILHDKPRLISLKPSDIECIHHAKNILLRQLDQPPSLIQLARSVHINEQKLKHGFKEVFGTTVFGFLRQKRLEKAKQLLEQQQLSVSEAALMVGYQNFSHFSALFRKTYGFNPSHYRKSST